MSPLAAARSVASALILPPLTPSPSLVPSSSPTPPPVLPSVTLAVLHTVGRGDVTLEHSLENWNTSGLLALVNERLLYVNNRREDSAARTGGGGGASSQAPPLWELRALELGFSLRGDARNVGVGPAMAELVNAARNDLVLFLEKDWVVKTSRVELRDSAAFGRYWRAILRAVARHSLVRVLLRDARSFYDMVRQGYAIRDGDACRADPPFHFYCESPFFLDADKAPIPWEREPALYTPCAGERDAGDEAAAAVAAAAARAATPLSPAPVTRTTPPGPLLVCHRGNETLGPWTNNPMILSRAWFNEAIGAAAAALPGFQEMEQRINSHVCERRKREGPARLAPPVHRTCVEGEMAIDVVGIFDHVEVDGR